MLTRALFKHNLEHLAQDGFSATMACEFEYSIGEEFFGERLHWESEISGYWGTARSGLLSGYLECVDFLKRLKRFSPSVIIAFETQV
ncbi:MAG: hypothetical protein K2X01_01905 [Cyanobacteria bacterium]|nr:hypothetical protein [Cyanobacteriota bacterium]